MGILDEVATWTSRSRVIEVIRDESESWQSDEIRVTLYDGRGNTRYIQTIEWPDDERMFEYIENISNKDYFERQSFSIYNRSMSKQHEFMLNTYLSIKTEALEYESVKTMEHIMEQVDLEGQTVVMNDYMKYHFYDLKELKQLKT